MTVRILGRMIAVMAGLTLASIPVSPLAQTAVAPRLGAGPIVSARQSEPVVITGSQIPQWTRSAATGVAAPYPSGSLKADGGDGTRSAHNGITTVPPDARTGVDPDQIAAYSWDGTAWTEVPVQVDQKYPYFLANGHSGFAFYSGTDQELTYAWNPTAHSTGEEAWKKVFGGITGADSECAARYQLPGAAGAAELAKAKLTPAGASFPAVSEPAFTGVPLDDYTAPTPDPVRTVDGKAELNDDDEIAMMARDAGIQAPTGQPTPAGTTPGSGQAVTILDPTSATDGSAPVSYIYLFLQPGGSSFNQGNGYVQMTRDSNSNEWIDRGTFTSSDPEKLGASNGGYGPNIPGTVCRTAPPGADNTPRASSDRFPRDGMTITTPTYRLYASGRWMVRQYSQTVFGTVGNYGPNMISRWKGRAFQQSPNSTISVVGFEDEQVNWEANGALLGWKSGPVRAIREIWGADSGTNVTKTETYYRDADVYHYHVRVHPIPPDGLYTSWDYRVGAVSTYYNQKTTGGVPIDGVNDNVAHVDQVPVTGQPAFLDTCDPTLNICSAILNPEEVAGPNGGMVYIAELKGPSSVLHPAVVPYYRDDACIDDGTGDGPPPRPLPGDASTDTAVKQAYVNYWAARGMPVTGNLTNDYAQLKCTDPTNAANPPWQRYPFAAAIGQMGLHFFFTADSDNAFQGVALDEVDAQQWRFAVPMTAATNVLVPYGQNVQAPLQTVVVPIAQVGAVVPEAPVVPLLLLTGGVLAMAIGRRKRLRSADKDS